MLKKYIFKIQIFSLMLFLYAHQIIEAAEQDKGNGKNIGNLNNKTVQEFVTDFIWLISKYTLTLLVGLTVLVFLYGLMKYMFKGQGSDTARTEGRKLMLWGIIGLFVMTSVWGLVGILASVVGHTGVGVPQFK